jgi:hypothetical protein
VTRPHDLVLPWDRAIDLVDMGLYMAKVHGRNRAYGICGLRARRAIADYPGRPSARGCQ